MSEHVKQLVPFVIRFELAMQNWFLIRQHIRAKNFAESHSDAAYQNQPLSALVIVARHIVASRTATYSVQ